MFIRVVIIGAKAVMLVAVVWDAAGLIVSTVMLPLPVSPENGVKCAGNCTVQWVTCQCTIAGNVTGEATGTYPCRPCSCGRGAGAHSS